MTGQPLSPEQIIQLVTPFFKGELETKYGNVFFGRMWSAWELSDFTFACDSRHIDIIWNLLEKSHGNIGQAKEIWSPIEDFSIPTDFDNFYKRLDIIVNSLKSGKRIFVHCFSGCGRTSLGLATILVRLGSTTHEALRIVQETAHGPETEDQITFVKNMILTP